MHTKVFGIDAYVKALVQAKSGIITAYETLEFAYETCKQYFL